MPRVVTVESSDSSSEEEVPETKMVDGTKFVKRKRANMVKRWKGNFHKLIGIQEDLSKLQVFKSVLPSHLINATILSYYGTRQDVCALLQVVSHQGRAYCESQNGLPGFVIIDPPYWKHLTERGKHMSRFLQSR